MWTLPNISPCEDPTKYYDPQFEHLTHLTTHNLTNYVNDMSNGTIPWNDLHVKYLSYLRITEDVQLRQSLIDQASDTLDLSYWCYLHQCHDQSVFITYPLIKILYPTIPIYLYEGFSHTVLLNCTPSQLTHISGKVLSRDVNQPIVFDLISQVINEPLDWIFRGTGKVIPESKIMDWYISNFGYSDMNVHPLYTWFHDVYTL